MQNLQKESSKSNLILGQKALNKKFNKSLLKIKHLRTQDDINQIEKNVFNRNLFIKNALKKLNKKELNELISLDNKTKIKGIKNKTLDTITPNKKYLEQKKAIGKVSTTNDLNDDIKIKNIIMLWNELEVKESYRNYFFFIYREIDQEDKISLYHNEINELIELKSDIKNLTYNIDLRLGIIKMLSEMNKELNKKMSSNKKEDLDFFIINDMMKKLEDLTIQTVNIVNYMKKIKKIIYLTPNLGKYNLDILAYKFKFDKNYIIKMKLETNFLRQGYAKQLFNIKNDKSPFIRPNNKINSSKVIKEIYTISLDQRVLNSIKECNYYIYKELIAYEYNKGKKEHKRCISPIRQSSPSFNYFKKNHFFHEIPIIKRENKNENLCLNFNLNRRELLNNIFQRDFNDNLKMNNSERLLQGFETINKNKSAFNKDNKILKFDLQLNDINKIKIKNKSNGVDNIENDFNKNNLLEGNLNKSEIISHSETTKSKKLLSDIDFQKRKFYNNSNENIYIYDKALA